MKIFQNFERCVFLFIIIKCMFVLHVVAEKKSDEIPANPNVILQDKFQRYLNGVEGYLGKVIHGDIPRRYRRPLFKNNLKYYHSLGLPEEE